MYDQYEHQSYGSFHAISITSANKDLTKTHGTMVDQISDLRKQV